MKNLRILLLLSLSMLGLQGFANESTVNKELVGSLQQLVVGSRTLMMNGTAYKLSDEAEFLSGDLRLLNRTAFKPGSRIMVRMSNDTITHVILNPTEASQFDQPNK